MADLITIITVSHIALVIPYIAEAALITMAVIENTKHYKSTQEITTSWNYKRHH